MSDSHSPQNDNQPKGTPKPAEGVPKTGVKINPKEGTPKPGVSINPK